MNRGEMALQNFNKTTHKCKRWVDRWYYGLGSLDCRICEKSIHDKHDVCLYNGKIMHVECAYNFLGKNKYKWGYDGV